MINDKGTELDFVWIGEREYSRIRYSCGLSIYCVYLEKRDQFGRRINRQLSTEGIKRKIDKAIEEKKK